MDPKRRVGPCHYRFIFAGGGRTVAGEIHRQAVYSPFAQRNP